MSIQSLNLKGLKCPGPTLKMTQFAQKVGMGDILEVIADCDTFETDVRKWCERFDKTLLWIQSDNNGQKRCHIQF